MLLKARTSTATCTLVGVIQLLANLFKPFPENTDAQLQNDNKQNPSNIASIDDLGEKVSWFHHQLKSVISLKHFTS